MSEIRTLYVFDVTTPFDFIGDLIHEISVFAESEVHAKTIILREFGQEAAKRSRLRTKTQRELFGRVASIGLKETIGQKYGLPYNQ